MLERSPRWGWDAHRGEGSRSARATSGPSAQAVRSLGMKQLHGGGFVEKIDGDGPVFMSLASGGSHGHPQGRWSRQLVSKEEGTAAPLHEDP